MAIDEALQSTGESDRSQGFKAAMVSRDRDTFANYLSGSGIELGACQSPLDLTANPRVTKVRYVDRHSKGEVLQLFPELMGEKDNIVETDIQCNILHGLAPIPDNSVDFVIACHIIEHLPNPIFFIDECRRVLKPGGVFFLGAPDKFYFPDAARPPTSLEHVLDDYAKSLCEVEDHHIEEFMRTWNPPLDIPNDPTERAIVFEQQRTRSIHVHAWTTSSFCDFLSYYVEMLSPFSLVDAVGPIATQKYEMLFILEKTDRENWNAGDFRRRLKDLVLSHFDNVGNRV